MDGLAARPGRTLRYGIRLHVITRDTSHEAWLQANRLIEGLDETMIAGQEGLARSESEGPAPDARAARRLPRNLEISPNLWAGVGLVRGGAGTALVGSHTEVADRIEEYAALGISEFILSGYPHLEEAYWFGEGVLPILRRRGRWQHPAPARTSAPRRRSRPRQVPPSLPPYRNLFRRTGRGASPAPAHPDAGGGRHADSRGHREPEARVPDPRRRARGGRRPVRRPLSAGAPAPPPGGGPQRARAEPVRPSAAELSRLTAEVAAADIAVFASPTYKAAYTGLLKAFLDRYGSNGLAGTIAVPVMTGGWAGHAPWRSRFTCGRSWSSWARRCRPAACTSPSPSFPSWTPRWPGGPPPRSR